MREDMESMWLSMKGSHYQRTMKQLANSIHKTGDLRSALTVALETVSAAIHAEAGTVWFYDRQGSGRIHPWATSGGELLEGVSLAPGEGIAGRVIENGRALIIKDCATDPRWADRVDHSTGFRTKSMICVPLILGECCFGSIQIINNRTGVLFDEKDLTFCEHLATEIALLAKEKGLLDDYLALSGAVLTEDIGFCDLLTSGTAREMERRLYALPMFAALSYREQQDAVKLCKKLRELFEKRKV